ncbi:glycosyltransferase family 4 protein [Natronolimnobius sp. AArcel1]|uniref:glycosyltransferase n=1 Tax=Natronolimnobius sp. AArcel1 TaxID=1679093 RepID=UPI0013E9FD83|nr:glycosyltransferase [Natronolimnobius sp. AArcel1]NGM71602.1 glycosyltransferase family 4 protein [Natronolimnobius sp. AArcel1]
MHIAFVSLETVQHRDTETNRRLRTIWELLRDAGHDVSVFCAPYWGGDHPQFEQDEITYHAITESTDARSGIAFRLPIALTRAQPDVVHVTATPPGQVAPAAVGATLARAPLVLEWYGDGGVQENRWRRWGAGRADRIHVPSELVATWIREQGLSGDTIDIVPNPIDLERIQSVDPGDEVDVVYARRLDEGANLESLFLGLAELRQKDWTATVIGDGPEREAYEQLASDLRIRDRITFRGECSREERIAVYRGAHVFAQTAEHCVFPTEMCWALASGCVGIVEYHVDSSAHELVEGWDRGFRTTSEAELADAIVEAGDLERLDYDDTFAEYDRSEILDRYLVQYRTLQDEQGLL